MMNVMSANHPRQCCEIAYLLNIDCPCRVGPPKEFIPFPKVHQHRGHAEQIGKYGSPGSKKYEKRRANRLRRRAERHDPENAPTRLIRGWND